MDVLAEAERNRAVAAALFKAGLSPAAFAIDWGRAMADGRERVRALLASSSNLHNLAEALAADASHLTALRFLMAPPMSQDRFALVEPRYRKQENSGGPLSSETARALADRFEEWADSSRVAALRSDDNVSHRLAVEVTASLIAAQSVQTLSRTRLAGGQEVAIEERLLSRGWVKESARTIDGLARLPPRSFMRKTKMITADGTVQEVDIACGLKGGRILAMECKVSNDQTNSIKRVNDVVKKAGAWQKHWGNFVATAAMLQGVFAKNEPIRLLQANILVFWSHDLDGFISWLEEAA
ncbi:MAG: XamI family restriction endonuclease [Solirubrobacterales bacterium]|nr:XamI family restriction endonuclease [Solirubrobacterales bacterium]